MLLVIERWLCNNNISLLQMASEGEVMKLPLYLYIT